MMLFPLAEPFDTSVRKKHHLSRPFGWRGQVVYVSVLMLWKHTFPVSERAFFQVRNSLFSCQKQPFFMSETVMFAETQVPSSSVCRLYHLFQGVVEILFREKLLDVYVHTVSPVVVRIGRDIYTLLVGIGEPQPLVRCQPVL